MIRWGRVTVVECDSCEEEIESEVGERWETFWPRARREGWKTKHVRSEIWTHGCPKHEA